MRKMKVTWLKETGDVEYEAVYDSTQDAMQTAIGVVGSMDGPLAITGDRDVSEIHRRGKLLARYEVSR